jgi:precorrin-3B synthase
MTATARAMVRGSCPGALRPMESGDGLIVRVRPRAGSLSLSAAGALARAAARFGNGHIDLTRRANLQIRGVMPDALPALQAEIDDLGLLDASAEAESVRNIIVSPLAGVDPDEVLDVRPIAHELERLIADDPALWRLPTKFGFVVDGGGMLPLADERADIRLMAIARDEQGSIAIGIDRPGGTIWLGQTTPDAAAPAACCVASVFLETQPAGSRARMRDGGANVASHLQLALSPFIEFVDDSAFEPSSRRRSGPTQVASPARRGVVDPGLRRDDVERTSDGRGNDERVPIGDLSLDGQLFALGIAAPFGRVEADMLRGLADAAVEEGVSEIRVSPWRAFYLPVSDEKRSSRLLSEARRLGFAIDPDDAVLRIEACPGAPACNSAALDTRAAALAISSLLPRLDGIRRAHVSGCAKGCACSAAADLVLVGGWDRFGVVLKGRADDTPESFVAPHELERLPALLAAGEGGVRRD